MGSITVELWSDGMICKWSRVVTARCGGHMDGHCLIPRFPNHQWWGTNRVQTQHMSKECREIAQNFYRKLRLRSIQFDLTFMGNCKFMGDSSRESTLEQCTYKWCTGVYFYVPCVCWPIKCDWHPTSAADRPRL